jgi:hypothetical protein
MVVKIWEYKCEAMIPQEYGFRVSDMRMVQKLRRNRRGKLKRGKMAPHELKIGPTSPSMDW